ncbi:hypothetical protein DSL62_17140 [Pantoea sp. 3_1284]|nr:hypothetical protein DSL62_17140 [Pantoea sp. 3_1284]
MAPYLIISLFGNEKAVSLKPKLFMSGIWFSAVPIARFAASPKPRLTGKKPLALKQQPLAHSPAFCRG